ncbi:MAG: hypothetical protein ACJ8GN_15955 [Longimicrobiaceae bacterium]
MLVLLIGVVCAYAASRASGPRGLSPRLAAACTALVGLAMVVQVWSAAGALRQYRFTLLGLRFAAVSADGAPTADTLRVGGDYETADLYAAGAGSAPAALVRVTGDSAPRAVVVSARRDAEAVVLVHLRSLLGERVRVLGGRPVSARDTIRVGGAGGLALTVEERGPPLRRTHWVRGGGREVFLPAARRNWRDRLVNRHPGPLQRTYPLADVLEALGEPGGSTLSSFFYYDDGTLSFADLDSELTVSGPPAAGADTLWAPGEDPRRFTVAGLPFRDYADVDLTPPERYGVRPLRSGRLSLNGPWLDFRMSTPEVRSFDAGAMRQLSLDNRTRHRPCAAPDRVFRVHLSAVRQSLAREAVTFSAPPRRFESASQAVLALRCDFAGTALRILTPAGPVAGTLGTPFTVGDGRREVIVRIDAKNVTPWGLLLLTALLAAPALLFGRVPVPDAVRGLAVCATGLAAVRLLMGLSAAVEYPFLQEASQTGIWLAAVLPWAVLLAGADRRRAPDWFAPAQVVYGAFALALTWAVFVDSRPKFVVLGGLALAVGALAHPAVRGTLARLGRWGRAFGRAVARPAADALRRAGRRGVATRPGAWLRAGAGSASRGARRAWRRMPGVALGAALLAARIVLAAANMSEAVGLGGTRVGISVFYTPLSLFLLVYVVRRHERMLLSRARRGQPAAPERGRWRGAVAPVLDIWAYLVLAFAGTAAFIADLGLALTTLPGALVFLLVLAERWSPAPEPSRPGRAREALAALGALRVALVLPLALFVLVQVQPRLALPEGDASQPQFRMQPWSTSSLRLLERGDPAALELIGQRRSEALGAMSETMRAYTRGPLTGSGFFRGQVSPELRATAAQEHAVSALLVGQWGLPGALGLVLLLTALLAPVAPWWRGVAPATPWTGTGAFLCAAVLALLVAFALVLPQGGSWRLVAAGVLVVGSALGVLGWLAAERPPRVALPSGPVIPAAESTAALFLLTLCGAGLYMVLANYGLVLFTGKNVYGLALDSIGDLLETLALFAGAALLLRRSSPGAAGIQRRGA